MRSLLWKEWREQRWKLGFACLMLGAFALIGLRARAVADETVVSTVCLLGVMLLPVLAVTGLVPAERADGTLAALLTLPVPAWQVLAAKTLAGVLLCAGPLAAAAVVSMATAGDREVTSGLMLRRYVSSAAVAVSLFVWMLALTVRLPTEARAGLLSLGVLVCGQIVAYAVRTARPDRGGETGSWLAAASPFVFTGSFWPDSPVTVGGAVAIQLAIAAGLWAWTAVRFARSAEDKP